MKTSYQPSYNYNTVKSGQRREYFGARDVPYNESRENIYNRQKDLHNDIEIDVPELVDRVETQAGDEAGGEDSFNQRNEMNVSAQILNDYNPELFSANKRRSTSKSLSKPVDQQQHSGLANSNACPAKVRRRIEDLYKWQERINKKQEVQREFQEQIKDSMYGYKIYTNELSNRLVQDKRPNMGVEDWLIYQGKAKEMRLRSREKELYGQQRVPSITRKGHDVQRTQDVHSRLYDLDRSRRERSRDAMTRSGTSFDGRKSRSRESSFRKKSLYSGLGSPSKNMNNVDFLFSPKDLLSPIESQQSGNPALKKALYLSSKAASAVSPTSKTNSPFLSTKHASMSHRNRREQPSAERNKAMYTEGDRPLTSNRTNRNMETKNTTPMNIYKRLTPNSLVSNGKQLSDQVLSGGQIANQAPDQNRKEVHQVRGRGPSSGTPSFNFDQSVELRKKNAQVLVQSESSPQLQTMPRVKQNERQTSLTPNHNVIDRKAAIKDMIINRPEDFLKLTSEMEHMEVFWDKILQDDFENRGKGDLRESSRFNSQREPSGYYQLQNSGVDINERSRQWVDKKNQKLTSQRKQKEDQELEECTFKPHFYTQSKNPKENEILYHNFIQRINSKNNNPLDVSETESEIQNGDK